MYGHRWDSQRGWFAAVLVARAGLRGVEQRVGRPGQRYGCSVEILFAGRARYRVRVTVLPSLTPGSAFVSGLSERFFLPLACFFFSREVALPPIRGITVRDFPVGRFVR